MIDAVKLKSGIKYTHRIDLEYAPLSTQNHFFLTLRFLDRRTPKYLANESLNFRINCQG
jgi:hypothetical protein